MVRIGGYEVTDRDREIHRLAVEEHYYYHVIAPQFGISKSRVGQIVMRVCRLLRAEQRLSEKEEEYDEEGPE